jgi:hypothetical protein
MKHYFCLTIFLAIIASCSSPKDKLENLQSNWVKADTIQINKERLLNRYQTALTLFGKTPNVDCP